ncbi:SAM-dependent methyltransferase [Nocardioides ginsengisegetis]|uniref:SAM-dependent methyltransferase n=1 Tax=Nocardioides ginsengisegetis TaxID=661491 RepID=A0A7W3J010_9ACTN|nr:class I SAM-dependent methyltransferase [Nocardioides ginsengisegetis]MBA8803761.1 SAM-dependent methyltransferase [Nocardioides ginsengisegetis]
MEQGDVDARIQTYYAQQFTEADRLTVRSAQGRLEFERVQELIAARIEAGSRILDIGGATGVHAAPLAALGHEVVLVDPVPEQVQEAKRHGSFAAMVGDARELDFGDDVFDVALAFGPMYHLATREDRLLALREAGRVVRPGGWVFVAAIPRFARHTQMTMVAGVPRPYPADWIALLEHGDAPDWGRFPGAHFHTAEELEDEMREAGLGDVGVCAIEGPDGLAFEQLAEADEALHEAALRMVRAVGHLPGVRDMSNHMMGIARVTAGR